MNRRVLYGRLGGQAKLNAYIRSLAPAAWFRQGVGITVTGSGVSQWDDQSGNGRHLLQGTDAARPIDLPFSGTRYLYAPGVAGNYASTPDSSANSITGDIDIRARVALDDWTPGANMVLASKYVIPGNYGFIFRILTTGAIQFYWTEDGTTGKSQTSSVAPTVSNGDALWIRATLDVNNGAGGYDLKFYTAADSGSEPSSWTQLGAAFSAGTTSIFDSTSVLEVGSRGLGATDPLAGKLYRVIIKNGIDGTTVVDFNPADADGDGDTSFASSTTGETWTINSSGGLPAQIVGRASALFNGTSHYLKTNAFTLNQPTTVIAVMKQVSWTAGEYFFDGNSNTTGIIIQAGTTPEIRINAGATVAGNTGLAVGSVGVAAVTFNGASSSLKINRNAATTGNAGANNMGGFTLGARADGLIFFSHIQAYEIVIFPIAPSTAQLDRLIAGLMARHGVAG